MKQNLFVIIKKIIFWVKNGDIKLDISNAWSKNSMSGANAIEEVSSQKSQNCLNFKTMGYYNLGLKNLKKYKSTNSVILGQLFFHRIVCLLLKKAPSFSPSFLSNYLSIDCFVQLQQELKMENVDSDYFLLKGDQDIFFSLNQ